MKVGIINVTGYAGIELARILHKHPEADVVSVTGRSAAGNELGDELPHLERLGMTIEPEITKSVDIVFSALPQVASAEACLPYVRDGIKVVDISADFRLHDPQEYLTWYGKEHPAPDLLETSVYGLTELDREGVAGANLVANPGCFANAALLAMAPVVAEGLITEQVIVDGKTGVSGAGRAPSMVTHFSEVNENVIPYSVDGHRHLPEMTQELKRVRVGYEPKLIFMPHLVPMTRGIFDTVYAEFVDGAFDSPDQAKARVTEVYRDYYADEPFVKVVSKPPQTKQTWGNNDCLIYPTVDRRTGRLLVFAVLDNLVKGAAGQAVQNMNVMFGIPETMGLEQIAVYP